MTICPLCGGGNAITLFTSTQCVNKSCSNYNASWESEVLDTANFNVLRHNAIKVKDGGFVYKDSTVTIKTEVFKAQVLFWARHNSYWDIPAKEVFADPDNIPKPDCFSIDAKNGSKHGKCRACPYNQFGSAPNGLSKACRQQIKLYLKPTSGVASILMPEGPVVLWVSPLNMNAFQNEFLIQELHDRGAKYTKSIANITSYPNAPKTFRRVKFEFDRDMTQEEKIDYDNYRKNWLDKIKYSHENPKY